MQRQQVEPLSFKKGRPKSFFHSWTFNRSSLSAKNEASNQDDNPINEKDKKYTPYKDDLHSTTEASLSKSTHLGEDLNIPLSNNDQHLTPKADFYNKNIIYQQELDDMGKYGKEQIIDVPSRRQSHLYTPFHDDKTVNINNYSSNYNNVNQRSYYSTQNLSPADAASIGNSSSSLTRSATWQPSTSGSPINCRDNSNDTFNINDIIPTRRASRNYTNDPKAQAKLDAILSNERSLYASQIANNHSSSNVFRRSTAPGSRVPL